jgi:hypothetical protein
MLWTLVEVLILAAFQCLLALICYALPLICCSALFAFQALWLTLALLAIAVATSLPLWRPELPSLLLMLACCLSTTDAAAATTVPAPL